MKEVYDDLVNHKVFGALIDTYPVGSAKDLFNDAKLTVNNIFDYSLNYGVVLGGEGRKLQPCLEHYIKQETEEIHHSVVKHVQPLKVMIVNFISLRFLEVSLSQHTICQQFASMHRKRQEVTSLFDDVQSVTMKFGHIYQN